MKTKTKKVWIGDPCYIIPNDQWNEALNQTAYFGLFPSTEAISSPGQKYSPREMQHGYFEVCGFKCAVSCTAYGDGSYADSKGNEYGVDAGMLGVFELPEGFDLPKCAREGGHIHEVPCDYRPIVSYKKGLLDFGFTQIDTGNNSDEDLNDY